MNLTYNSYITKHHANILDLTAKWDKHPPQTPEEYYDYGCYYFDILDFSCALNWFIRAAQGNYPEAFYKLGYCLYHGFGITSSPLLALECFKAYFSKTHNSTLPYSLASLDERSLHIAMCYHYGYGVTQNYSFSLHYFQKTADKSSLSAYELGIAYKSGLGHLSKSDETARKLFIKSYELLHGQALFAHYSLYRGDISDYPYLALLKTGYSYELGRYMRVTKVNPCFDSYKRLAFHYGQRYPNDSLTGDSQSMKKSEKYYKLANKFEKPVDTIPIIEFIISKT